MKEQDLFCYGQKIKRLKNKFVFDFIELALMQSGEHNFIFKMGKPLLHVVFRDEQKITREHFIELRLVVGPWFGPNNNGEMVKNC